MPATRNADVHRRLAQARVAHLATVDAEGRPHIIPICFACDRGMLYTALDRKPKRVPAERLARLGNIRAQPRVALLVDHYTEDWSQLWYVLVRGKAQLIPESARVERARAVRALRKKYAQYSAGMLPEDAPLIRIRPERTTSWAASGV